MDDNKETKSRIGTENKDFQSSIKSLLVLYSYHHRNTEKIAKVFAKVLDAEIKWPKEINPEELLDYDLVGFGSSIYSSKHHESVLELVDKLLEIKDKKAFIF